MPLPTSLSYADATSLTSGPSRSGDIAGAYFGGIDKSGLKPATVAIVAVALVLALIVWKRKG